ncbi:MAG: hypothetical protein KKD05_00385 [Candidatus Omnitrophica bacterium]|nr:hypothetical protein [Candidatus Omnitrophota bacterium]
MDLFTRVKEVVQQVLEIYPDIELVDLCIRPQNSIQMITVLIDTPQGVLLDQCVKFNKMIGYKLEENAVFKSKYNIEVCSPGIDRILKTAGDFKRVCGKTIKLTTINPGLNEQVLVGVLSQAAEDKIFLEVSKDNEVQVNLDNIKQARLEIGW